MKRTFALFLTFLYLLPASGFALGMHVCGKRITSVNIENFGRGDCSCGTAMRGGCCKTIHVVFKINENQKAAAALTFAKNDFGKQLFASALPFQLISCLQPGSFELPDYHAPPPLSKHPVYLENCVFRI